MAFRGKGFVQPGPVVGRAADGSGVDLAQQTWDVAGQHPVDDIVGASKVSRAFDSHPVPTGPKYHCQMWPRPKVLEFPRMATRNEPNNRVGRHRMVEHARVHHGRLKRPVSSAGNRDSQSALSCTELSHAIEENRNHVGALAPS